MAYYFIHGTEETTSRTGRYPAPNPFHATYSYDASIAQFVEDTCPQESHEATATISSSQSESDGDSSAPAHSQSDQSLNDENVDAQSSISSEETLSSEYSEQDPESVEERHLIHRPTNHTHPVLPGIQLVPKGNSPEAHIEASFKPPSDKLSEIKICSSSPDRKQESEALGPGLSQYSQDLMVFKDPTAPFGTPGREELNRFPEKSWEGNLLPDVTDVCYLRLLCLYPIDEDRIIWGAEVKLMDFLAWFKNGRGSSSIPSWKWRDNFSSPPRKKKDMPHVHWNEEALKPATDLRGWHFPQADRSQELK
ncbi:hypothetical protein F5146DRAFT_1125771 [Armillaria mellea]|nr:hypothetical protein F5146DRAFT_1125771 [Armillaria mellea]